MGFDLVMNWGGLVMTGEYSLFYRMKPQGTTINLTGPLQSPPLLTKSKSQKIIDFQTLKRKSSSKNASVQVLLGF